MEAKVNKVKRQFIQQQEIRHNELFDRPISSQYNELSNQEPDWSLLAKFKDQTSHRDVKLFTERHLVVIGVKLDDQVNHP